MGFFTSAVIAAGGAGKEIQNEQTNNVNQDNMYRKSLFDNYLTNIVPQYQKAQSDAVGIQKDATQYTQMTGDPQIGSYVASQKYQLGDKFDLNTALQQVYRPQSSSSSSTQSPGASSSPTATPQAGQAQPGATTPTSGASPTPPTDPTAVTATPGAPQATAQSVGAAGGSVTAPTAPNAPAVPSGAPQGTSDPTSMSGIWNGIMHKQSGDALASQAATMVGSRMGLDAGAILSMAANPRGPVDNLTRPDMTGLKFTPPDIVNGMAKIQPGDVDVSVHPDAPALLKAYHQGDMDAGRQYLSYGESAAHNNADARGAVADAKNYSAFLQSQVGLGKISAAEAALELKKQQTDVTPVQLAHQASQLEDQRDSETDPAKKAALQGQISTIDRTLSRLKNFNAKPTELQQLMHPDGPNGGSAPLSPPAGGAASTPLPSNYPPGSTARRDGKPGFELGGINYGPIK